MRRILLLVVAAVVVAAGGIVYARFAADIASARARVATGSRTVKTRFGTVQYAVAGQGAPILIIHGTGGGFDQGLDMTAPLAEAGYRLIVPSRFGYLGSSFPADASVAMQADAFADLLDAVGVDRAFVFGGSAGALSAMQFAIRHPRRCRALVLLVPVAYAPARVPNASGADDPILELAVKAMLNSNFVFWGMLRLMPDGMTRMLLATDPAVVHAADAGEQARVRRILWHILPVSARTQGLTFDMQTAGAPPPYPLEQIACPVLTLSVEDDLFQTSASAKYIAAGVPDGRAVLYPTGGHVWAGHDNDVWREIVAFLSSVADGGTDRRAAPATLGSVPN